MNPFFLKLKARGANLWMDTSSLNSAVVHTYKSARDRLFRISANKSKSKSSMLNGSNSRSSKPTGVYKYSPILLAKAVKNLAELEGTRSSHLRFCKGMKYENKQQ